MTRPKVNRYTVTAFGPDLMAVLLKGAREEVLLPCPDQRTMKHIQMRLNMLRGAMFREKHPQWELVTRARTTRTWPDPKDQNKGCVLKVYPNDSQFASIFEAAGIRATQHDRDILENLDGDTPSAPEIAPEEPDPYQKWKKLI